MLALCLTVGCKAQVPPAALDAATANRRIEIMVRSEFNIPYDYDITLGARTASQIPGYDKLPVTIFRGAKSQVVDFLISADGNTLARLEKFDLAKDPVFSIDVSRTAHPRQSQRQGNGGQF